MMVRGGQIPRQPSILYLGDCKSSSTSRHRAEALRRLGCSVSLIDPVSLIGPRPRWLAFVDYRTGFRLVQSQLLRALKTDASIATLTPDIIWINGGERIGALALRWLQERFRCPVVLYNNDDPTGWRDRACFATLRSALPLYSLAVFCRAETALEALALGACRVMRVWMAYDELQHRDQIGDGDDCLTSIVSFVGTHMPGEARDQFLVALAESGIPVSIAGGHWRKSRLYHRFKHYHVGWAITGQHYALALRQSAISLGLLSHLNRDLVTQRSFETASCLGLLCAEKTSEHQLLYEDGQEAVFWDSVAECIDKCNDLLADRHKNHAIRIAGFLQVLRAGCGNEDICHQILRSI